MKTLVQKTTMNGDLDVDSFRRGLLEWRNTPRANGESPAQALYGRPLPSFLIAHHSSFAPEYQQQVDLVDKRSASLDSAMKMRYNDRAHPLPALRIGIRVDMQDPKTKLWRASGVVVAIGRNRDYLVKVPSGRTYWRNRRFLRPLSTPVVPPEPQRPAPPSKPSSPPRCGPPRRSSRRRRAPNRLNISTHSTKSYD